LEVNIDKIPERERMIPYRSIMQQRIGIQLLADARIDRAEELG
jgi:hypothetical protein